MKDVLKATNVPEDTTLDSRTCLLHANTVNHTGKAALHSEFVQGECNTSMFEESGYFVMKLATKRFPLVAFRSSTRFVIMFATL